MKKLNITIISIITFAMLLSVMTFDNKTIMAEDNTVTIENNFTITPPRGQEGESTENVETIELEKNPERVVIFDLGLLTTFVELGLEDKIAGLPKGDNNVMLSEELEAFASDDYVNLGGLFEPNYEQIAMINPELIIISGRQSSTDIISEMKRAAPNAEIINIAADTSTYLEDVKESTMLIGELYEKESEAEALVEALDEKIEAVKDAVDAFDSDILFVQTNGGDLAFHGTGGRYGFLFDELNFSIAGEQSEDATDNHGNQISFEFIAESDPGLILVMDRGAAVADGEPTTPDIIKNDVTKNVTAVKEDRIYEVSAVPWYLHAGGYGTVMIQLDELLEALE